MNIPESTPTNHHGLFRAASFYLVSVVCTPNPPIPPGAQVFAIFSPYALLVLVPVNISKLGGSNGTLSNINTFNRLSMSNISGEQYDSRMWLHALGLYLLSALAMYFLVVEYRFGVSLSRVPRWPLCCCCCWYGYCVCCK